MAYLSYADSVRPRSRASALVFDLGLILAGSVLLAVSAQAEVRLPFSPVPITAQTLVVLLIGACFGSRRGLATMLAYLVEGWSGLPVFAGGHAGFLYFLGPTGGYLVGFAAAAFVTGLVAERGWDRHALSSFFAMLLGNAIIYLFGLAWLSRLVGADHVIGLGLVPFVPGDLIKLGLGTLLLPVGWSVLGPARAHKEE